MRSKLAHGFPCFGVPAMLHEPTRRFRAEVDAGGKDEGRNEGRAKFKAPRNLANILKNDIGAKAEEDTFGVISQDFQQKKGNLPTVTQSCQNMTRAPRIRAGAISAE
jgi:hypothetical protein